MFCNFNTVLFHCTELRSTLRFNHWNYLAQRNTSVRKRSCKLFTYDFANATWTDDKIRFHSFFYSMVMRKQVINDKIETVLNTYKYYNKMWISQFMQQHFENHLPMNHFKNGIQNSNEILFRRKIEKKSIFSVNESKNCIMKYILFCEWCQNSCPHIQTTLFLFMSEYKMMHWLKLVCWIPMYGYIEHCTNSSIPFHLTHSFCLIFLVFSLACWAQFQSLKVELKKKNKMSCQCAIEWWPCASCLHFDIWIQTHFDGCSEIFTIVDIIFN